MQIREEVQKAVRGFGVHGVRFTHETDTGQVVGDCPFTGKEGKFYVNHGNLLWDSKTAGVSGNFGQFLELVSKKYQEAYKRDDSVQRRLARDRGLPRAAFKNWRIGWTGKEYTIPVRSPTGRVVDVRLYRPGGKTRTTAGCSTGLLNADKLIKSGQNETVYVCEGEWDAIALRWLLQKLNRSGIVVSVPGANTFKREWVPWFDQRDVQILYDHDEAGETGELLVRQRLAGAARSVSYVEWPNSAPEGWDVRDWIVRGVVEKGVPRGCWKNLKALFLDVPRRLKGREAKAKAGKKARKVGPPVSHAELVASFRKWLHMRSADPLAVVFGTILANRLPGDPLWLFLVGPPGSLKSELCMAVATANEVYPLSSLTPHALVSGASWAGGDDPSLMPKLDGKVLTVKDFTTVLAMHPTVREEIFGQLRDAYDGSFEKQFGTGVLRRYKSHFGILAGVTPTIDQFSSLAGLGERFLKYRLERNLHHADEAERIKRAISNVSHENKMRSFLQNVSERFLHRQSPKSMPSMNGTVEQRVIKLAMLTARLRGVVSRDRFNQQLQVTKGSYEVGTRIGKQLTKLAVGVAMFYGHKTVGEEEYRIVAQVGLSSAPDKVEEVVRTLYENTRNDGDALKTKEVCESSERLTLSTVFRTLQDLQMLGLVEQRGKGLKYQWSLPNKLRRLITGSCAYEFAPRDG